MRICLVIFGGLVVAAAGFAAGLDGYSAYGTSVVRADRRTGRLVRVVLAPKANPVPVASSEVPEIVVKTAKLYDLDPLLVHSVIQTESNYDPFALSPKGAQGLMQLMPSTARRFGVTNSFDINQNLQGGVTYLKYLFDLFGDQELALAAYNAGEQAVIRYGGVPPYPETLSYVKSVSRRYSSAKENSSSAAAPAVEPQPVTEPVYRPVEYFYDARGNLHVRTR